MEEVTRLWEEGEGLMDMFSAGGDLLRTLSMEHLGVVAFLAVYLVFSGWALSGILTAGTPSCLPEGRRATACGRTFYLLSLLPFATIGLHLFLKAFG